MFDKITTLLTEMNETLAYTGLKIETNTEYTPDSPEAILSRYDFVCHIDENTFVYGRGHRKSREQRYYERLKEYNRKTPRITWKKFRYADLSETVMRRPIMMQPLCG